VRRRGAQAYVALAFLTLFWGYSWVAIKVATHDASPMVVAWVRCGAGAVALLVFMALTGRSLRPTPFLPTLVYGILQTAGFTLVQTTGVSLGGAGKAAVLVYTMPFWLALLAWAFLDERITGRRWLALAFAAAGLVLVVGPLHAGTILANVLPVTAGALWALSAVWVIRLRAAGGYDLLSLTAWQMVWGSVVLAPFALVLPVHVRLTGAFVASMAFLAVFSTAVGWALWLFLLSRLPASVAGLSSLATPVVGVALAAAQLHEVPSRSELAGMACIVTALVLNARAMEARPATR
jgi:drug/metabolite transporter (DMT)-like permease